jgi:hypothetical protein
MEDGSTFEMARRERPKLLFDPESGAPTHFYHGAMAFPPPTGRDGGSVTYTGVQPLNVKANRKR